MLVSQPCRMASLRSEAFLRWADRLRPAWDHGRSGIPVIAHRKLWEWLYIAQALDERGLLGPGRRGLGFGVGREPLVALFASLGCRVVATDLPATRARRADWPGLPEGPTAFDELDPAGLCERERLEALVELRPLDMRSVPDDLRGFDFVWSSCALEHLGSLRRGARFVLGAMRCLRPGGVAVHTTELNVSGGRRTLRRGRTVLYRPRDLERLAGALRAQGHRIELDLEEGREDEDLHVDLPPYSTTHLRVRIGRFEATSVGLIIEASPNRAA